MSSDQFFVELRQLASNGDRTIADRLLKLN